VSYYIICSKWANNLFKNAEFENENLNVRHAIELRKSKDNKTDFYRKLEMLIDRIHIYKHLFTKKVPSFMKNTSKASSSPKKSPKRKKRRLRIQRQKILRESSMRHHVDSKEDPSQVSAKIISFSH